MVHEDPVTGRQVVLAIPRACRGGFVARAWCFQRLLCFLSFLMQTIDVRTLYTKLHDKNKHRTPSKDEARSDKRSCAQPRAT